jgi:hypothetical protein
MTCQNLQNKLLNIILVYLVFVGEFKKNVTRQTWRVLVSVHSPFWRVFEKNGFPHCVN